MWGSEPGAHVPTVLLPGDPGEGNAPTIAGEPGGVPSVTVRVRGSREGNTGGTE